MVGGHGHSSKFGDKVWEIGEQSTIREKAKDGDIEQSRGNFVDAKKIIERYNNPNTVAAIIFSSCFDGETKKAKDVLVVRSNRLWGALGAACRINETQLFKPKESKE